MGERGLGVNENGGGRSAKGLRGGAQRYAEKFALQECAAMWMMSTRGRAYKIQRC